MLLATVTQEVPPSDLETAIRAFFPESEWVNALNVAYLESGWNRDACNWSALTHGGCGAPMPTTDGVTITAEFSVGYFQINVCNYIGWNIGALFRAEDNVGTAHALWDERGWQPWYFSAQRLGLI